MGLVGDFTRIVLVTEYNGSRYHGFQYQVKLPTVQSEMEKAILRLTGERRRVIAASRTDAGVHAKGQVASFKTGSRLPSKKFVTGLNYYLPRDIAVRAASRVSGAFNVRREALSREYEYYILNRRTRSPFWEGLAYQVADELDIGAMNQACQALIGEHDFASFVTSAAESEIKSSVRTVHRAQVDRNGELVVFSIVANSFLPHQVRNTVGTLIRVGLGKMKVNEFYSIMTARKPGLAKPTAPAYGLYLVRVNYSRPFTEISNENL